MRPVRIDPTGTTGPTPGQARGSGWRKVSHGWYVAASAPHTPEQRVLEMSVLLPTGGAVTVEMDMAAAAGLISIARMRAYTSTRPGWIGVPQARTALDLADEKSRSPNETRMRLIWLLDAGFPPCRQRYRTPGSNQCFLGSTATCPVQVIGSNDWSGR